jgi:hypothetical protein
MIAPTKSQGIKLGFSVEKGLQVAGFVPPLELT